MATVIGIFGKIQKKKPLPVVRPGTQSRSHTYIRYCEVCYEAKGKNVL